MSSCARMRISPAPSESYAEWGLVCRGLAVCAVPTTQRCGRALHELQPGWRMLSAGFGSAEDSCRCEQRDFDGSVERKNAVSRWAKARIFVTTLPALKRRSSTVSRG